MATANKIYKGVGSVGEPPILKLAEGKITDKIVSEIHGYLRDIADKINFGFSTGGWTPNESMGSLDGQCVHVVFPTAPNTATPVYHQLGRIPKVYTVKRANTYGKIKDANSAEWTDKKIQLQCDTADAEFILALE